MINIKQGPTFAGWTPYPGLILFAFGTILIVQAINNDPSALLYSVPLAFFGLLIFLNIKGTLIDPERKRCRMYQDFLLFRIGLWLDLGRFDRVVVSRYRESFSHFAAETLGRTAHVRSYFVTLKGSDIFLHLNECESRQAALRLATAIAVATGTEVEDKSLPPKPRADRRR